MNDFKEFIELCDNDKESLSKAHIDEFNRLLKEFKDPEGIEDFGGELYRVALISSMASIHTAMNLLENYHDWLNQN